MKAKITLFFLLTLSLVNAQVPSFTTKKSLGINMCARHSAGQNIILTGGVGVSKQMIPNSDYSLGQIIDRLITSYNLNVSSIE